MRAEYLPPLYRTGAVYAGGGIGGAVFSLGSGALLSKLGVPLTLRILGCIFFAMTMPCALMLKGRAPKQPFRGGAIIDTLGFFLASLRRADWDHPQVHV